ncbi:MAG TPA: phosphonate metabolism protein/1,5-bisphosphokinase (PRPP-forming) PhnN [Alphaproteobacteria bacterium]
MASETGRLVYVMGPSGAGKDSVLREARSRIDGRYPVAFAHRYITRPPTAGDENHVAVTVAEFELRRARGLFAMSWKAHGLLYGIGIEVEQWQRAGLVVVVSGSRQHFQENLTTACDVVPVLITADTATLARRLSARGRESDQAVTDRLSRGASFKVTHPNLVTIDNSGALEHAGQRLADLIVSLISR